MKISWKLFVVTLVAIFLSMPVGSIYARPMATCSGATCNGVDPNGSGCSAVTAKSEWKDGSSGSGTLRTDLRWSSGCQSNWSRVTNEYPYQVRRLRARLTNDDGVYITNLVDPVTSSDYGQIWTDMYDGANRRCAIGSQGLVGYSYDTTTKPA